MLAKKAFFLFPLLSVLVFGCAANNGKPKCTEDTCVSDPDCLCWCSVECDFRKKNDTDSPIYVENDKNGKFCYCKQRDLDNYEENCTK